MSLLNWLRILGDLTKEDIEELNYFCQEKYVKEWEVLFYEWEDCTDAMYILKTWKFEVSKIINWKKVVLWIVRAEEVLWEMALFWDIWKKRMATAKCIEDSILVTMLSFSITELSKKDPKLLEKIKDIIRNRIISNKIKEEDLYSNL